MRTTLVTISVSPRHRSRRRPRTCRCPTRPPAASCRRRVELVPFVLRFRRLQWIGRLRVQSRCAFFALAIGLGREVVRVRVVPAKVPSPGARGMRMTSLTSRTGTRLRTSIMDGSSSNSSLPRGAGRLRFDPWEDLDGRSGYARHASTRVVQSVVVCFFARRSRRRRSPHAAVSALVLPLRRLPSWISRLASPLSCWQRRVRYRCPSLCFSGWVVSVLTRDRAPARQTHSSAVCLVSSSAALLVHGLARAIGTEGSQARLVFVKAVTETGSGSGSGARGFEGAVVCALAAVLLRWVLLPLLLAASVLRTAALAIWVSVQVVSMVS